MEYVPRISSICDGDDLRRRLAYVFQVSSSQRTGQTGPRIMHYIARMDGQMFRRIYYSEVQKKGPTILQSICERFLLSNAGRQSHLPAHYRGVLALPSLPFCQQVVESMSNVKQEEGTHFWQFMVNDAWPRAAL